MSVPAFVPIAAVVLVIILVVVLSVVLTRKKVENAKKKQPEDRKECILSAQCGLRGSCYSRTEEHDEGRCYDYDERPSKGWRS